MRKVLLVIVFIAIQLLAIAEPHYGTKMLFEQPDGSQVEVYLYGDEFYMRGESPEGYTLLRDPESGWICFAELSSDASNLVSTGIKYTGEDPVESFKKSGRYLEKHIDVSPEHRQKISGRNMEMMSGPAERKKAAQAGTVQGNFKGITILVDFSDRPATLDVAVFDSLCNGKNFTRDGNNGSVWEYYNDVSGGLVNYKSQVFGWYRASKTFAEYDAMDYTSGAKSILKEALEWVDSQGFDFSKLSLSGSNIQAINLVYTGWPAAWSKGMWYHKGWYGGFTADGVWSGNYNTSPANSPVKISTICHENGHMLCGWPDTYKYSGAEDGIGGWDLMCSSGSKNPPPPNPHFRNLAGWGNTIEISGSDSILVSNANDLTTYRYTNSSNSSEFYLIESRLKEGRSATVPDEGLTIWHINRDGNSQAQEIENQAVRLEHAFNKVSAHHVTCFKEGYIEEFSEHTLPSSKWKNGTASGLRLFNVGSPGSVQEFQVDLYKNEMINKDHWEYLPVQTYTSSSGIASAFDKDPLSEWKYQALFSMPHDMIIDLGAEYDLNRISYLPERKSPDMAMEIYKVYASADGSSWGEPVAEGTWSESDSLKSIPLNLRTRYLRLEGLADPEYFATVSIAEIYLFGKISGDSPPTKAISPFPEDGESFAQPNTSLRWKGGDGASEHLVYFGTDSILNEDDLLSTTSGLSAVPEVLERASTYFWRVDEKNENGTTTGEVWSFRTVADNVALYKAASASSMYNSTYTPLKAVDGNVSSNTSRWLSGNGVADPHWLEIDLGHMHRVNSFRLYTGYDGYNNPIIDFIFQYYDGGNWLNATYISGNRDAVFESSIEEVQTEKVRLYVDRSSDGPVRLYELEVYGASLMDCNGDLYGTAYIDECGNCVGGNTGLEPCIPESVQNLAHVDIKVYPNPASTNLHLEGHDCTGLDYGIYDIFGRNVNTGVINGPLNIQNLPEGIYILKVGENYVSRFIKR